MDPAANSHLLLTRAVTLVLLVDSDEGQPMPAELIYNPSDPFAVSLLLGDVDDAAVWCFSRELLSGGLHEPTGDGDVHVWPFVDGHGSSIILIELSSPDGVAILQADTREINGFLTMSHEVVAPGEESAHSDIDAVIAAILAAAPPRA